MKSNRRLDQAIREVGRLINSTEANSEQLKLPEIRQAFAILDTLNWARGYRTEIPEILVSRLVGKHEARIAAAAVSRG